MSGSEASIDGTVASSMLSDWRDIWSYIVGKSLNISGGNAVLRLDHSAQSPVESTSFGVCQYSG